MGKILKAIKASGPFSFPAAAKTKLPMQGAGYHEAAQAFIKATKGTNFKPARKGSTLIVKKK